MNTVRVLVASSGVLSLLVLGGPALGCCVPASPPPNPPALRARAEKKADDPSVRVYRLDFTVVSGEGGGARREGTVHVEPGRATARRHLRGSQRCPPDQRRQRRRRFAHGCRAPARSRLHVERRRRTGRAPARSERCRGGPDRCAHPESQGKRVGRRPHQAGSTRARAPTRRWSQAIRCQRRRDAAAVKVARRVVSRGRS